MGFEIHGGGIDLVFPHHENEAAQTRMGRGAELAQIWMHNGMLEMRGEKMAKSVGNISLLPEVIERWGRDDALLLLRHRPLPPADRLRRRHAGGGVGAAGPDPRGRAAAGRRRRRRPSMREHRDAFFAALADDFNTSRALAPLAAWVSEANKREDVGRDDLVEMLDVLRAGRPRARGRRWRRRPTRRRWRCWPRATPRATPRTGRRPTACATRCGTRAGRSATVPPAPSWCRHESAIEARRCPWAARRSQQGRRDDDEAPRKPKPPRDRDRPKPRTPGRGKPVPRGAEATSGASAPPAHEPRRRSATASTSSTSTAATRSSRRCAPGGARSSASGRPRARRKEPWLDGVLLEPADGDWLTQRCGSDAHQGLVRRRRPLPVRRSRVAAQRAGAADRRARRDPGPAEPRRDRPLGRGRGRQRDHHPQPAQRRGHRRGGQGVGGRGRAPQDRPGPQPRRLPRRGQGRRLLGLRRGGQGPPVPRARLHRRRRAGHGRRGDRPAPAGRARCATTSSRCRCAAGSTRSTSRRPPRCCSTASSTPAPRLAESAPSQESLHQLDGAP